MFNGVKGLHNIHKAIFLDPNSPIQDIDATTGKFTLNNTLEEYIYNCSQSLGAIDRAVDKSQIAIQQVKTCISRIPKNSDYTTADYMEYALENYIIRSRSIYDRVLIFIGSLLDIGVSNDSITHNLLITNRHVKNNNLDKLLKPIKKSCDTYQYKRNVIIHHDNLIDEEFDTVSMIINVNHLSAEDGRDEPFSKGKIKFYSKQIIDSRLKEYNANLKLITDNVLPLYESCEIIYMKKKLQLLKSMK